MKPRHVSPHAVTLFAVICLLLAPALDAVSGGPDGDVLRPGRSSGLVWNLGLDAGITYSSFSNGPISFRSPNPYWGGLTFAEQIANWNPLQPDIALPLESTIDGGSGLGFVLGATADLSLSRMFGLALKVNYHTRNGSFENEYDTQFLHPTTTTGQTMVLRDEVDWSFTYIGVDLLARIQLLEDSWYVLVGPSFGSLNSNNAKLTQTIVRPDDIYYTEQVYQNNPTERQLKSAGSEGEITGFESSRFDLKAGVGTWIPLGPAVFLTPEVTVAIPLTKIAKGVSGTARFNPPFTPNNPDWNALTIFATVGIRWRLK